MPVEQTGRELSVFCSRCKTRKFRLTCILDLFDQNSGIQKRLYHIILYMLYRKTTETILISGMVLKNTSKNHCSLLQVFTCVGTVARISKNASDKAMTRGARITRNAVIDACEEGKVWQVAIQLLDGADTVACLQ